MKAKYEIKPVPNFPGYYADTNGDIWSSFYTKTLKWTDKPQKKLKQYDDTFGYKHVVPIVKGKPTAIRVHKLVCLAFHGVPKGIKKPEVRHLDDNHIDNRPTNLAWGTHAENFRDAVRNGCMRKGETHPKAVLTEEDVLTIRKRREQGELFKTIAADYGMSQSHIGGICSKKFWRHI